MKYLFLLVQFIGFSSVFAQHHITDGEHDKYWFYRKRLKEEFVNIGLQSSIDCNSLGGQSIPAAKYYTVDVNGIQTKKLIYSEDNLFHLGIYHKYQPQRK